MASPKNARAVVANRIQPIDSLDFFPTPPWVTRALMVDVLIPTGQAGCLLSCWEPAAGMGHMVGPLREFFSTVYATDVHDYGVGFPVGSFIGYGFDFDRPPPPAESPEWVITNPPFVPAEDFLERGLDVATVGVALFLPTRWTESPGRYRNVFSRRAPSYIAQFAGRASLVEGRWDPAASTATAYAWYVWLRTEPARDWSRTVWIKPDAEARLTLPDDVRLYAPLRHDPPCECDWDGEFYPGRDHAGREVQAHMPACPKFALPPKVTRLRSPSL